jgi:hypothetical protein
MPRIYNATDDLTLLDDNHYLLMGYKDALAEDKKMLPSDFIQSYLCMNEIINGGLDIWQRGSSFAAVADGDYTADRMGYEKSGAMVHTISREASILPNTKFNYSMKIDVTTADASIAAGDYCAITHVIEGYNIRKYLTHFVTLGFWVRSPKTGIHCVAFRNDGKDRSYVVEYTVDSADTWEYKTITIELDESAGTWDYTNGAGLRISWCLAGGTTYQTSADAWQTGNYFCSTNQVNVCDNTANNFYITGITFNLGKLPIRETVVDLSLEILRAQRYYEKSYDINTDPGTITNQGAIVVEHNIAGTFLKLQKAFASKKRDVPTMKWWSNNSGNVDNVYDNVGSVDVAVSNELYQGEHSTGLAVASASLAGGAILSGFYTADAEISL